MLRQLVPAMSSGRRMIYHRQKDQAQGPDAQLPRLRHVPRPGPALANPDVSIPVPYTGTDIARPQSLARHEELMAGAKVEDLLRRRRRLSKDENHFAFRQRSAK